MKSSDSGTGQTVERLIDLQGLLAKKSHFLLGPRQTGKSFLVRAYTQERARLLSPEHHRLSGSEPEPRTLKNAGAGFKPPLQSPAPWLVPSDARAVLPVTD